MWQDDYAFADQPGKQLTRLSRTQYRAELNMVKGRPTRHFGIRGSTDPAKDPKRNRIVIKGKTTRTEDIDVQFRFTLEETSGTREIFRSEVHQVALGGPCGELRDFEVTLEVPDGIPARSDSPPFFTFQSAGDYRIIGELIRPDGTGGDCRGQGGRDPAYRDSLGARGHFGRDSENAGASEKVY